MAATPTNSGGGRLATVAVVGASLAGINAAETLRRCGYDGRLVLIGDEPHAPYDRPPLSKEILQGKWTEERLWIRPVEFDALEADKLIGVRAERLDLGHRRLCLSDGSELGFDGLIIATGTSLRRIRGLPEFEGVHYLRTLDDALAIRRAFDTGPRLLVVGAGFIGSEVAASARASGLDVTVLEALGQPMLAALGPDVARVAAEVHRDNGVDLRCGLSLETLEGKGRVERARLSDGSLLETDLVVIGVGVGPATGWLEGSGLTLDDGVVCDEALAAGDGIYAAGDLARWTNPRYQAAMRVEHWTNAVAQGTRAAENLLAGGGEGAPFDEVPSFWSDQFGIKIQMAGLSAGADEIRIVAGSTAERKFLAFYRRDDRFVGVVGFQQARHVMESSDWLAEGLPWPKALERAGRAFG